MILSAIQCKLVKTNVQNYCTKLLGLIMIFTDLKDCLYPVGVSSEIPCHVPQKMPLRTPLYFLWQYLPLRLADKQASNHQPELQYAPQFPEGYLSLSLSGVVKNFWSWLQCLLQWRASPAVPLQAAAAFVQKPPRLVPQSGFQLYCLFQKGLYCSEPLQSQGSWQT